MTDTLTAVEIAKKLKCSSGSVYAMVADGDFPPPINPRRTKRMWRWGEPLVERVINGEWTPT